MKTFPWEIDCPNCHARLTVDDASWLGTPVSCPECGAFFTVPEDEEEESPLLSDISSEERVGEDAGGDFGTPTERRSSPPVIEGEEDGSETFSPRIQGFLFGALGVIAALLLAIILALKWGGKDVSSPSPEDVASGVVSERSEVVAPESGKGTGEEGKIRENDGEGENSIEIPPETDGLNERNPDSGAPEFEGESETSVTDSSSIDSPNADYFQPTDPSDSLATTESDEEIEEGVGEESGEEMAESTEEPVGESTDDSAVLEEGEPDSSRESISDPGPELSTETESGTRNETSEEVSEVGTEGNEKGISEETSSESVKNGEEEKKGEEKESDEESAFETFSGTGPDALTTSLPKIKETGTIDIPKRLSFTVNKIQFVDKRLPEVIRILSELSGVPIRLDLTTLSDVVETLERPISFILENVTVGEILDRTTRFADLRIEMGEGEILLTASDLEKRARKEIYFDVADILNGTAIETPGESTPTATSGDSIDSLSPVTDEFFPESLTVEFLARFLNQFLTPEFEKFIEILGREEEGTVTIPTLPEMEFAAKGNLLSSKNGSPRIENKADSLLEQVRSIRRLPPVSDKTPEELIPETIGWENLSERISLQFVNPVPLREALAVLEFSRDIHFLMDETSSRTAGAGLDSMVKISVTDQPVHRVLSELLSGLGLDYVILTGNQILITSREEATRFMTTEVHLLSDPETFLPPEAILEIVDRIKMEIAPESWRGHDPTDPERGEAFLRVDPYSGILFIHQSQPNQRRIRQLLESLLEDRSFEGESEPDGESQQEEGMKGESGEEMNEVME